MAFVGFWIQSFVLGLLMGAVAFRFMIFFVLFNLKYLKFYLSLNLNKIIPLVLLFLQFCFQLNLILHLFLNLHFFMIFFRNLISFFHHLVIKFVFFLLNLHPFFTFTFQQATQLLMLLSLLKLLNHLLTFSIFYSICFLLFFKIFDYPQSPLNNYHFL